MTPLGNPTPLPRLVAGDALDLLRLENDSSANLIVSSPPYNIKKPYERDSNRSFDEYRDWQTEIAREVSRITLDGGSVCWQVGNYVDRGELFPLDALFIEIYRSLGLKLRNRIIWKFNFGLNADKRFSGRYETLLWFTKGTNYKFNLDSVRVPQLYPGKRHSLKRGEGKGGLPSGNPLGKNPSDFWEFSAERDFLQNPVWDFPNVKANHPEKTSHPCQFPIELAERCVLAFSDIGDRVLDPFVGTGATVIAAQKHNRSGVGFDRDRQYLEVARGRLEQLRTGTLRVRPIGKPVRRPSGREKVARLPDEWRRQVG